MIADHVQERVAGLAAHNYVLVASVLDSWEKYPSFLLPTGVLTISVVGEIALNVFDNSFSAGIDEHHTHIKGFRSWIVCGELTHLRWRAGSLDLDAIDVVGQHAGKDRQRTGTTKQARLSLCSREVYQPGDTYKVEPEEIHSVTATPGTVTLLTTYECKRLEEEWVFNASGGGMRGANPAKGHADKDAAARIVERGRMELASFLSCGRS